MAGVESNPKKSDLGVRTVSALVMVGVAGTALWLGGTVWILFVMAVALGVLWEWRALALKFASGIQAAAWIVAGMVYVGAAAAMLLYLRNAGPQSVVPVLYVVLAVIGTDVGAYFAGRTIGGPKIAPRISPSKTWAGLGGGMFGASLALLAVRSLDCGMTDAISPGVCFSEAMAQDGARMLGFGMAAAVIAQAGDFFDSWMKRRAGVKDSGRAIPGHGGVFDRVDGLLAILFAMVVMLAIGSLL